MKHKPEQFDNFFGLSKAEQMIFKILSTEKGFSYAQITQTTKIPRTSAIRSLASLSKRDLVRSQAIGKRLMWFRTPTGAIEHHLQESTRELGINFTSFLIPGFTLLYGKHALTNALWKGVRSLPRNGRFMGIQPADSADVSVEKMGVENVIAINEFIKKRGIISEGVLSEHYISHLMKKHGQLWLKSFAGRLAHTTTVQDIYLAYTADIYLFGNKSILLVNWSNETAIAITDSEMISLLSTMFRFMHDSGKRIDNNALAKKVLQN